MGTREVSDGMREYRNGIEYVGYMLYGLMNE